MADATTVEAFIHYLEHQRLIVDHLTIVAAAILVYDFLLTIRLEITLLWFSPWSYTKILYLLVRYLPIGTIYFELRNQLLIGISAEDCKWNISVMVWLLTATLFIADIVLSVRTWAVWRRGTLIGWWLSFLVIGAFVIAVACNAIFYRSLEYSPPPYPGFRGCFALRASRVTMGGWIAVTFLDINVLLLMLVSAYRAYKQGDKNRLLHVIHRDGVLFYIYLLAVTLANLISMLVLPDDFSVMLVPVQAVIYSVLTCRIVINIREYGQRDMNCMALHAGYEDTIPTLIPLAFRTGDKPQHT